MSTDNAKPEGALYLIQKYGGYYRPNAAGYINIKAEAGRYTLEEAIRHSHPNGPDGPRDGITYVLDDTPSEGDDEGPCTDRWDTGITIQTERPCSCQPHPTPVADQGTTQADRDAAADMMDAYHHRLSADQVNDSKIVAANVRLGHFDSSCRVQAFRAHRLAHQFAHAAEVAELRKSLDEARGLIERVRDRLSGGFVGEAIYILDRNQGDQ